MKEWGQKVRERERDKDFNFLPKKRTVNPMSCNSEYIYSYSLTLTL